MSDLVSKQIFMFVQNWLAFMMTTGRKNEDYILTDKITTPETDAQYYSEKMIWLPVMFSYVLIV